MCGCERKKLNIAKTKVIESGMNYGKTESSGKWPCAVCTIGPIYIMR